MHSVALELSKAEGRTKIIVNDIEAMKDDAERVRYCFISLNTSRYLMLIHSQVCQEIRDDGGEAISIIADCKYAVSLGFVKYADTFTLHHA